MRFLPDGPVIPSHLLTQRNEGNVIFFCGAGVSRRAGLDDFAGLTQKVIDKLQAEDEIIAFERLNKVERHGNSDRIFRHLAKTYGQFEVDRELYTALCAPDNPDLSCHQTVVDLSRGVDGRPQLVTTNFDLLFEAAEDGISSVVPPVLPDLSLQQSIDGVVYLHGRLRPPEVGVKSGYIISSADFGRAYLSEGWAARFVKALRERFTIVLLGYRAEDPPMRYLLEGLDLQFSDLCVYRGRRGRCGRRVARSRCHADLLSKECRSCRAVGHTVSMGRCCAKSRRLDRKGNWHSPEAAHRGYPA
jgi:SIR2-like domain